MEPIIPFSCQALCFEGIVLFVWFIYTAPLSHWKSNYMSIFSRVRSTQVYYSLLLNLTCTSKVNLIFKFLLEMDTEIRYLVLFEHVYQQFNPSQLQDLFPTSVQLFSFKTKIQSSYYSTVLRGISQCWKEQSTNQRVWNTREVLPPSYIYLH